MGMWNLMKAFIIFQCYMHKYSLYVWVFETKGVVIWTFDFRILHGYLRFILRIYIFYFISLHTVFHICDHYEASGLVYYSGIYFSAQWCSPCRSFTPILKRFFEENTKDFAVVFVSSDIDQSAFDEYFSTMPWYAVPYTDTELKVSSFIKSYLVLIL
jgi:thiol-disulfide isomerase/thioredoxin